MRAGRGGFGWAAALSVSLVMVGGMTRVGLAQAGAEVERPGAARWVHLEAVRGQDQEEYQPNTANRLLERQLLRQAVLIAARDGLGMLTRDAALGEPMPEDPAGGVALRAETYGVLTGMRIRFPAVVGDEGQAWSRGTPGTVDLLGPLAAIERWSREDLVELLRGLGLEGEAHAIHVEAEPSEAVRGLLEAMNGFAQYEAVRQTHRVIREQGESPALLGALVRGYANLGELTRHHWNVDAQVFAARSLLYAQRLAAVHGEGAWSRWHRAYALAMVGRDAEAIADLEAAAELVEPGEAAPTWVGLLDAYTHFRPQELELAGAAEDGAAGLALYLRFLLAERNYLDGPTLRHATALLRYEPLCFRAIDAMAQCGGVSNLHRVTTAGPKLQQFGVHEFLTQHEELPRDIVERAAALEEATWPTALLPGVVASLIEAGDPERCREELSWAVLGRMIEETNFVHVFRRASFMQFSWGVEVDAFIAEALPSVAGHRYAAVIEALGLVEEEDEAGIQQAMASIAFPDVGLALWPLFERHWWGYEQQGRKRRLGALRKALFYQIFYHADDTAHDLALRVAFFYQSEPEHRLRFARKLERMSPYSPLAAATRVELDWEGVQSELAAYESRYQNEPVFLKAIAQRYRDQEMLPAAQAALERYIAQMPDRWGYETLAEIHLEQGDEVRWKQTLDRYLREGEDSGLSRARIRSNMAEYYMERDRDAEGLAYAEAAAESWASWAMSAAARANEGVRNWERAELWNRRRSERYASVQLEWYWWCQWSGHGDLAAARDLAEAHFAKQPSEPDDAVLMQRAVMDLLEGELERALAGFEKRYAVDGDPWDGLHLAILAHRLGQPALRDRTLAQIVETDAAAFTQKDRGPMIELVRLLRPVLPPNEGALPDLAGVDRSVAGLSESRRINVYYFVAELLEMMGQPDEARVYLERCVTPRYAVILNQVTAYSALRERGIDPHALPQAQLHPQPAPVPVNPPNGPPRTPPKAPL